MSISAGSLHKVRNRPNPWRYVFYFNGKKITKSGFPTRKAAQKAMEAKKRLIDEYGREVEQLEFSGAYKRYLEDLIGDNTAANIMNKQAYGKRFAEKFGGFYVHQITPFDVQRFKIERKRAGTHASGTIDLELGTLKHFFKWAVARGYTKMNPAKDVKMFHDDYRRGVCLTQEQARKLLEVSKPDVKLRILLALGYGLRHGEIANIKKEEVDFPNKTVTIYRKKKKRIEKSILEMPDDILEKIQALPNVRGKREEYIFPNEDCEKSFKTALKDAGLIPKKIRFHDLRHTAASWQLQQGTSLETIRKFLGHSEIETTARYLHTDDREVHVAALKNLESLS